ncbi:transglutaminaseTgpA domain-containing protein [Blastococcus sp. CCUG 61487]|uniref:transglutaminase TgpA family protein n=1 Tax=Blastococcus sp. CCUG 61487 TaxID=1840703 RepID=UPI00113CA82C|nr:transglutaminaseTgpA domain-containing protein [Blastococcus sp. CCUG 61487]TKJ28655.1 hypothetical protein A6V29_19825 [Blastococcus sp. CCUG 61487]
MTGTVRDALRDVDVRTPVAAAVATLLGALALAPVFAAGAWLRPAVDVVLVVLAAGLALRAAGAVVESRADRPLPGWLAGLATVLVPVGQLAALAAYLTARFAPDEAMAGVVPTGASTADLLDVLAAGADEVREQVAPALPVTGLLALVAVFVGLVAVLVDLVAVAGRQGGVAGLALLALFCVPVFTLTGGIGLLPVVAPAAGLALLLWADQARRITGIRVGGVRGAGAGRATRIALAALVVGVLGGGLLPTLSEGWLEQGSGGPSSTGTALNPMATMVGQLSLPDPVDLLRVETDDEDPGYLRAVTVDHYDAAGGWSLAGLSAQLPLDAELPVEHPPVIGRPVAAAIEVLDHDDRFLPMPVSPTEVRMEGGGKGWWFDPTSGTAVGHRVTTEDRRYEVTATEARPTPELLAAAPPLEEFHPLQMRYTALPELDERVTGQVAELVDGVDGGYDRVRRILDFLTDRRNGFRYALSTLPGTSGDDLVNFLAERQGYCEQYAGAMAVMVRAAGMPARVALGYTPGTREDDGSRIVTTDDAHAWVEVYFVGVGWVPFDPTPIDRDRRADLPWAPRFALEDRPDIAALPAPAPGLGAESQIPEVDLGLGDLGGAADAGAEDSRTWPLVVGFGLLAAGMGVAPAGLRLLQRRRRLADGSATALWDELTATADDLGVTRDPAWTPREAGRALAGRMPAGPGAAAVGRLARAEERASYGPATSGQDEGLDGALREARRALAGSVDSRERLRAAFWPASLVADVRGRVGGWSARLPRFWRRDARRA